jgi:hypothetical protein
VAADDDIIRAYDEELGPEPPPRSNRGFWVVVGTLLLGGVFLVVEIFANRPLADSIGHAQQTLREAQAVAEVALARTGGFGAADADALSARMPNLTFRSGDESSAGLNDVSVSASDSTWAAAVQIRPGACFYLKLDRGGDPLYGSGTECTGTAALNAQDARW